MEKAKGELQPSNEFKTPVIQLQGRDLKLLLDSNQYNFYLFNFSLPSKT